MIKVDEEKLKAVAARRGFASLEEIAIEAKRRDVKLSLATIYNIANNSNWTRDKLQVLCEMLECLPTDFVEFYENEGAGQMTRNEGFTL